MRVLIIDELNPILRNLLTESGFTCTYQPSINADAVKEIIHDYEGLILRGKLKVDKDLLALGTNLKFIGRAGAGMENIDVASAESIGVQCLNAPEGNRNAVAEHAIGMILGLFRKLNHVDRQVREGVWEREPNRGLELEGRVVGILGYGNMGEEFAKRLSGFNVEVIAYDKYKSGFSNSYVRECTEKDLFENTEILSLHVPLTDETQFMVNLDFLNQFKKDIYLINTARGKVVSTKDLVEAMETKKVKGVCLDVIEYEGFTFNGLDHSSPKPLQYLINSESTILSPHIAGVTKESSYKISETLARKIIREFAPKTVHN